MPNEKILLVDTEKNVLNAYQSILSEEGYSVDIVTSEDEALEALSTQNYQLLITELYLKGKDTFNLIEQAKHDAPEMYIIIITSAFMNTEIYEAIINIGADDYFTKPFSANNLLVHIKKGIQRREILLKNIQLENRLNQLDFTDYSHDNALKLTVNTSFLNSRLQDEISRADRYDHPFSLILVGINFPKMHINTVPSVEKTSLLNQLFQFLFNNTRRTDVLTNHNGNFALILTETSKNGAEKYSLRLQDQLAQFAKTSDPSFPQQLYDNINIDYHSYPENSDFINTWIKKLEE